MSANREHHLLLVEDEQHIASALIFNLQQEGYKVSHAETGEEAMQLLQQQQFSLAILDRMLPGGVDGLSLCRHIRAHDSRMPILMLTAMNQDHERINGLRQGADDYVVKPFVLDELLLRIAGMLRRSAWYRPVAGADEEYCFANYRINLHSGSVTGGGRRIQLTELELKIARVFFDHEGEVLSRAFLLQSVWGLKPDTATRTLDNFIVRLRKYMEENPARPRHFVTVRGQGYCFYRNPLQDGD